MNGFDTAGNVRHYGTDTGGNNNVPCTGSFGDVKGLDTWTFFPTALAATTVNIVTTGTISGHVFSDPTGNGIQGGGEPNLGGLTVTITTSTGGTVNATTDASGNYSATVPSGNKTASVAGPAGAKLTTGNNPQTASVVPGVAATATQVGFQSAPPASTAAPAAAPTPSATRQPRSGGGGGSGGGEGGSGGSGRRRWRVRLGLQSPRSAAVQTQSPTPLSTPAPTSDSTPAPVPAPGTPQLNLSVVPSGPLVVGQEAALLLTISNTGSVDAVGPLIVTDALPAGLQLDFASDDWGCSADGQTVTCSSAGSVSARSSILLQLNVLVGSDALGGAPNVATLNSRSIDVEGVTVQSVDTLIAVAGAFDTAPAAAASREPPATRVTGEASTRLVYEVQGGETLSEIATMVYGDANRAADLYAANQDVIDEHGLVTGVELVVP